MPQAAFLVYVSLAKEDFHTTFLSSNSSNADTAEREMKEITCETIEQLQGKEGFRSLKACTVSEPKCFTDFCSPDKYLSLKSGETYS